MLKIRTGTHLKNWDCYKNFYVWKKVFKLGPSINVLSTDKSKTGTAASECLNKYTVTRSLGALRTYMKIMRFVAEMAILAKKNLRKKCVNRDKM